MFKNRLPKRLLDHRISIERQVPSKTKQGGTSIDWETVHRDIPARIFAMSLQETTNLGRSGIKANHYILCHAIEVKVNDRIICNNLYYYIVGLPINPHGQDVYYKLVCQLKDLDKADENI